VALQRAVFGLASRTTGTNCGDHPPVSVSSPPGVLLWWLTGTLRALLLFAFLASLFGRFSRPFPGSTLRRAVSSPCLYFAFGGILGRLHGHHSDASGTFLWLAFAATYSLLGGTPGTNCGDHLTVSVRSSPRVFSWQLAGTFVLCSSRSFRRSLPFDCRLPSAFWRPSTTVGFLPTFLLLSIAFLAGDFIGGFTRPVAQCFD
jgi:hypothetical protein